MFGNEHSSNIIRILIKYLPHETGKMIELFLIISDLKNRKHQVNAPPVQKPDIRTILNEISEQCDEKESGTINMIMNVLNALDFYNNNKELMNMLFSQFSEAAENADNSKNKDGCKGGGSDKDNGCYTNKTEDKNSAKGGGMFDVLSSFLTPEQCSMFEMFQSMSGSDA